MKIYFHILLVIFSLFYMPAILSSKSDYLSPQHEVGDYFIKKYSAEQMKSNSQNWSIVVDLRGIVYIGNMDGVLEFDGREWRKIPVSNNSVVRSLAMDSHGKIFVGAYNELGFLEVDSSGGTKYKSLVNILPKKHQTFNDVWSILSTTHGVYYLTDMCIFRYFNNHMECIKGSSNFMETFENVNDKCIGALINGGFFSISNGILTILPGTEKLKYDKLGLSVILPYEKDKLFIMNSGGTGFIYNLESALKMINEGNTDKSTFNYLSAFKTQADSYIKRHGLDSKGIIIGEKLILGTKSGGLVVLDKSGRFLNIINKNNGLEANYISWIASDNLNNLWVAHLGGVSYIEYRLPITYFGKTYGIGFSALDTLRYKKKLYIAGYKGVFNPADSTKFFSSGLNEFFQLKAPKTQCFALLKYKNYLLMGGGGFYITDGEKIRSLANGNIVMSLGTSKKFPNYVFAGTYPGFLAIEIENSENKDILPNGKIYADEPYSKIKDSIFRMAEDEDGNLWLSTIYNGVIFLKFTGEKVTDIKLQQIKKKDGLYDNSFNFVTKFRGEILISSTKGILQVKNGEEGIKLIPYKYLDQYLPGPNKINLIYPAGSDNLVVDTTGGQGILWKKKEGGYRWDANSLVGIKGEIQRIFYDGNDVIWINTDAGLYRLNVDAKVNYFKPYNTIIRKVSDSSGKALFNGTENEGQISEISMLEYEGNGISFDYISTFFERGDANKLSFKLDGYDEKWSKWEVRWHKEYTNLPPGDYSFKVKSKNIYNVVSNTAEYKFKVLTPWYRTVFAYILYLLLLILFISGIVWLNSRRLIIAGKKMELIIKERTAEIKKKSDELKKLATIDALTEISNFRKFNDFFQDEWKRGCRKKSTLSLILIDVDFFKQYNDTYGHIAGDKCLQKIAQIMDKTVGRASDIVARYGGEEFIVVLPETGFSGVEEVAEKLRNEIENAGIIHEKSIVSKHVTISLGCASTIPIKENTPELLLKAADDALYKSKEEGRNRFSSKTI